MIKGLSSIGRGLLVAAASGVIVLAIPTMAMAHSGNRLSLDLEADLKATKLVYDVHFARARWMTRLGYRLLLK